jgi:hypothetical protein
MDGGEEPLPSEILKVLSLEPTVLDVIDQLNHPLVANSVGSLLNC